jgi:preprotein translocase subunit SecD
MRTAIVLLALAVTGCPKRKEPERGYELTFKKPGEVREVIERRLAQASVKARITEDSERITLRFPGSDGNEADDVIALLAVPGKLEFCAEAKDRAVLCAIDAGVAVEREPSGDGCFASAGAIVPFLAATSHLTGTVLSGTLSPGEPERTFLTEGTCLAPRILETELTRNTSTAQPMLALTFDGPGATSFAELTTTSIRRRLLVVLDGRVTSAPVVMEPITGGKAMITFGAGITEAEVIRLGKALRGGALPAALTLERQGAYGPPTLLK